jgi:CRP/FNR family transcriptional regulator, cyclic AMP receptor protein
MDTGATESRVEDPLTYLPRKPLQDVSRGRVIYDRLQPSGNLYLVVSGHVTVATTAEDGRRTIVRIVGAEGLFGESALLGEHACAEQAVALEPASLMKWTTAEIEQQIERGPRLGVALAQYLVERSLELQDRIESMALHKTPERVAIALLQFAGSLGRPMPDGTVRVPSPTHQVIAEYVGTSREIVTCQMNRLRKLAMVCYSRRFIDVNVPALEDSLRSVGITTGLRPGAGAGLSGIRVSG